MCKSAASVIIGEGDSQATVALGGAQNVDAGRLGENRFGGMAGQDLAEATSMAAATARRSAGPARPYAGHVCSKTASTSVCPPEGADCRHALFCRQLESAPPGREKLI